LIGAENIFPGKASAIANIFQRLDHSICERCPARIFLECKQVPYKGEVPAAAGAASAN